MSVPSISGVVFRHITVASPTGTNQVSSGKNSADGSSPTESSNTGKGQTSSVVQVWQASTKSWVDLSVAGLTVPVADCIKEWQEDGIFKVVSGSVYVWNGSAWIVKSTI
jgi:hypothetical protein